MREISVLTSNALQYAINEGVLKLAQVVVTGVNIMIKTKPLRVEVIQDTKHYNTDATFEINLIHANQDQGYTVTYRTKTNLKGITRVISPMELNRFFQTLQYEGVTLKGEKENNTVKLRLTQTDISSREESLLLLQHLQVLDTFKSTIGSNNQITTVIH